MSPVPIIERQRALTQIGEIRTGGEMRQTRAGKPMVGAKLEAFRFTSAHRDIIERVPPLYGGEVAPWESPAGPAWQVESKASALPVKIVLGYSLRLSYELWEGKSKHARTCDGITEAISGQPCLCNAEGADRCGIATRLKVLLPQMGTLGAWRLASNGETAARELAGAMDLAELLAQGRPLLDATLRLTQRKSIVEGQTVKFVVPVLDFDPQIVGGLEAEALPRADVPVALNEMRRRASNALPIGDEAPLPEPEPWPEPALVPEPEPEPEPALPEPEPAPVDALGIETLKGELYAIADELKTRELVEEYVAANEAEATLEEHRDWLARQVELAQRSLAGKQS